MGLRVLSPPLGFLSNFTLTFVYLTWVAFNFTFMLSVVGPGAAYVAGIHNHLFTDPSRGEMMLISTVLTILFGGLMIIGVRAAARFMAVAFGIVWIGMLIWFVLMLVGSHSGFVSHWDAHSGSTVSGIIAQANKLGFNNLGGIGMARDDICDGVLLPGLRGISNSPGTLPAKSETSAGLPTRRSSVA